MSLYHKSSKNVTKENPPQAKSFFSSSGASDSLEQANARKQVNRLPSIPFLHKHIFSPQKERGKK